MRENLAESFLCLPYNARKQVHRLLCAQALELWREFIKREQPISYVDSVVGMAHKVDFDLPSAAFDAAFAHCPNQESEKITQRYLEPIAALQDMDLEFPDPILMSYYAVYNAFCKYARHENIDEWLIVSQALATNRDRARENLQAALEAALQ